MAAPNFGAVVKYFSLNKKEAPAGRCQKNGFFSYPGVRKLSGELCFFWPEIQNCGLFSNKEKHEKSTSRSVPWGTEVESPPNPGVRKKPFFCLGFLVYPGVT